MTASFDLHLAPLGFGPGSQPETGEDGLSYTAMPSGMRTYLPHLPMVADPAVAAAGRAVLGRLLAALRGWLPGQEVRLSLDGAEGPSADLIAEVLGEGEVAAVLERPGGGRLEIQESVLAGVWRLRTVLPGEPPREALVIGAFPRVALGHAFAASGIAPSAAGAMPEGVMNAPAVLTELRDRSARWRPGDPAHVVNFTLLPLTPEDRAVLDRALGTGALTVLSRGYGNCRVTATATANVWWVSYYNSTDALILDTVEVTGLPEVVCAAPEDIADSAGRLAEILDALGTAGGAP